jgi:membrane protein required for colicin V production
VPWRERLAPRRTQTSMSWLDAILIAVIVLSTILAYVRGFVREVVAIAAWIVGFVVALRYSDHGAGLFASIDIAPAARHVLAFVVILIATLVAGSIVAWFLKSIVHGIGLGFVDRFLGAVFGVLRGALLTVIFALIAGVTTLPRHDWWQNSLLGPAVAETALALRPYLPAEWAARLDFSATGKTPGAKTAKAMRKPDGVTESCAES